MPEIKSDLFIAVIFFILALSCVVYVMKAGTADARMRTIAIAGIFMFALMGVGFLRRALKK